MVTIFIFDGVTLQTFLVWKKNCFTDFDLTLHECKNLNQLLVPETLR